MTVGRMSVVRNGDRYFTIAVDEFDDDCIKGMLFHDSDSDGILFDSLLEMFFNMDRIFDQLGSPKQTVQRRQFSGIEDLSPELKRSSEKERPGKLATFYVFVQYRYYASWQGNFKWIEGDVKTPFESELDLILSMYLLLTGNDRKEQVHNIITTCHVAIDSYQSGKFTGNYQNIPSEILEQQTQPVDMAKSLGTFMEYELKNDDIPKYGLNYGQLISSDACMFCRRGGKVASFSIKVLFHEHSTWQGIIYWREGRQQQLFRSYKEMLYLIASVAEASAENNGFRELLPAGQGLA
ncbi:MAG: hypothetical protein K0R23_3623 [Lacrimispora sp.]|jgi:hypothetical protein|nr:hypothetical protein [Lacrimispora sp.]